MRTRALSAVAVLALACLVACGTPGAPQPPALELARRVSDLKASRKGDKVTLTWTTPRETTDRARLKHPGVTRVCRGIDMVAMSQCAETVSAIPPAQAPPGSGMNFTDVLSTQLQEQHATGFAYYAVEVQNTHGRSAGLSNQVIVPLAPSLPPPQDVRAEATPDGVELRWRGSHQAASPALRYLYRVYRQEQGVQQAIAAGEVSQGSSPETTILDRSVEWEKTYSYWVRGVTLEPVQGTDQQVEGEDSPHIQVFVHDIFPPAMPSGLQAVSSGLPRQAYIDLSWAPNTESDLAGYNVYRHEEGRPPVKINGDLVKTPTYRDSAVQPGHGYFYSVSAVDLRGNESGRSEEASESVPQ